MKLIIFLVFLVGKILFARRVQNSLLPLIGFFAAYLDYIRQTYVLHSKYTNYTETKVSLFLRFNYIELELMLKFHLFSEFH